MFGKLKQIVGMVGVDVYLEIEQQLPLSVDSLQGVIHVSAYGLSAIADNSPGNLLDITYHVRNGAKGVAALYIDTALRSSGFPFGAASDHAVAQWPAWT